MKHLTDWSKRKGSLELNAHQAVISALDAPHRSCTSLLIERLHRCLAALTLGRVISLQKY